MRKALALDIGGTKIYSAIVDETAKSFPASKKPLHQNSMRG